jgi:predicted porin
MKTKLLAGVIATCFAAPVLAQSSVTIYGIADAGIHKTAGQPMKVVSGIADGSRLGFKGTEDIGGGFKAIFNLEARIELDTGTQTPSLITDNQGLYLTKGMTGLGPTLLNQVRAGLQPKGAGAVNTEKALFDRTAYVGLITPVGAFMLGRMYTPGYEVFAAADVFESGTAGTWGGITGGTSGFTALGADIRSQKSIQYRVTTPTGLGGSLMYGTKQSGYLGRYNRFVGAMVTYKANGVDVGIGHNRGTDQSDRTSLVTTTVGGSYTTGDWKLFAGYHDQRNKNSALLKDYIAAWDGAIVPALTAAGVPAANQSALRNLVFVPNITRNTQVDANSLQVGFHYKLGAGRVMASASRQNDRTTSNSDATQYAVGYDYFLSKRTDIYTVASYIRNQNDGQYTPGAASAPGGFTVTPGANSRAYQVGIRHKF